MTKYLYLINYAEGEEMLCQLEMKVLFNQKLTEKWLISPIKIDPSRSVFLKERLTILYEALTYENLFEQVKEEPLSFETFKLIFLQFPGQEIAYRERLKRLKDVGFLIGGEADMYNPKQLLGLTELNGNWYFGPLELSNNDWVTHENKPNSYSFSLGVRTSRAIANLAVRHNFDKKIIDPCCGVGTVLLEVLAVGGTIVGNELNDKVAEKAVENLKHYGYEPKITIGDIKNVEGHYDVAIIDLPYGHFGTIEPEIQQMIIKEARRIASQLILVTQIDMVKEIQEAGFNIIDQCQVLKGRFVRYITICE